ncbi:MAG: radical SAM protein [Eubacterium sp.]|nr:radical SAM protein [Eubacterium sp.]
MKRLINFILPVQACNFKCHYCYIGQENRFNGEIGKLQYSQEHMQRALTISRMGGVCHFNICGLGETLLAPYAAELAERLLENGHFVSIVTNGTITEKIQAFMKFSQDFKKRLFFKFSFHYLELKRLGMLDLFFANVAAVSQAGISFTVELTVNDETVPDIPKIKELCNERINAYCHVIESRNNNDGFSRLTKFTEKEHQKYWETFESPLFKFQQKHWMVKRREFCYAGDWVISLDAGSGWITPCFAGGIPIQNVFEDITEDIHFMALGCNCQWTHCYAAYVLLTSGVIPDIDAPAYATFRNRCTSEGKEWLTPEIKKFFSEKLYEDNAVYSKQKKEWINILNSIIYSQNYPTDIPNDILYSMQENLRKKGIKKVAVYGSRETEMWMYGVLSRIGILCRYGLVLVDDLEDRKMYSVKNLIKYPVKRIWEHKSGLPLLMQQDKLPNVDLMIVCDTKEVSRCRQMLRGKVDRIAVWNELVE